MSSKRPRANIFSYAEFDIHSVLSIAQNIRHKSSSCDESQHPESGSFNWAISISFEDGIEWILRSPRKAFGLQQHSASAVLASEVATLKYLRDKSDLPVPEVFSFCPTDRNDIGVPYILMSKAPGIPLGSFIWDHDDNTSRDGTRPTLTLSQKQKVMRQLGKIHASLSKLRLDRIGSLLLEDNDYVTGKCLSPTLIWNGRDEFDEDDIPLGPFNDAEAFYRAQVHALLAHAKELPMEHHLFHAPVPVRQEYGSYSEYKIATDRWNDYVTVGSKIESVKNREDYILAGLALLDFIPLLAKQEEQFQSHRFPLCHPDLSTSNVFVDEDLNVTCIIDWACTSSVPKSMLLIWPGLPHSRNEAQPDLVTSFAEGFTEGKGFDAQQTLRFEDSDVLWQFARLVNLDSLQDYNHLSKLFHSLAPTQEPFLKLEGLKERTEFITSSEQISRYDTSSEEVAQNEKQYFSCNGPGRLALASYLSTIAKLNPKFVADRRLWNWVATYLKERDIFMFPARNESREHDLHRKHPD